MKVLEIEGGTVLKGAIDISGNKNAILPMIAASLLTEEEIIFENVPDIIDVHHMLEIIRSLGVKVEREGSKLLIEAKKLNSHQINHQLCSLVRTSILFVAPLLYRFGKAEIYPPGGDIIGKRRLDTHFYGLEKFGVTIDLSASYSFSLDGALKGSDMFFDEASVTATEHIMMGAVVAEGKTIIRNAASEPHVQDLAILLNKMGAKISGIGTNQIEIEGVSSLKGTQHRVVSDHIEAGSFLAIAAATGGNITVRGVEKHHYWMIRRSFETLGIDLELKHNEISLNSNQKRAVKKDYSGAIPTIADGPWPQLPSDIMSILILLATQVEGNCLFFEKMFESRLYFVDKLVAMGANVVVCDPHRVVISGPSKLSCARLSSPDIRAGMALVGAGICAKGVSHIYNIDMVNRGYEKLIYKLEQLGAKVRRIND